jgi:hypothetical protein
VGGLCFGLDTTAPVQFLYRRYFFFDFFLLFLQEQNRPSFFFAFLQSQSRSPMQCSPTLVVVFPE